MAGPAVVIIDLQLGMMDGSVIPPFHDHEGMIARTQGVLAWARAKGLPVIFIQHSGEAADLLAPGKPGWVIHPAIAPIDGEPVLNKTVGDAFAETDLAARLEALGTRQVILLGAQTDQCVNATFHGAAARGLEITVVGDTHSTWPYDGETAEQIIERYNGLFRATGAKVVSASELIEVDS
jgi:nicotinamidase-related amidase